MHRICTWSRTNGVSFCSKDCFYAFYTTSLEMYQNRLRSFRPVDWQNRSNELQHSSDCHGAAAKVGLGKLHRSMTLFCTTAERHTSYCKNCSEPSSVPFCCFTVFIFLCLFSGCICVYDCCVCIELYVLRLLVSIQTNVKSCVWHGEPEMSYSHHTLSITPPWS